MAKKRKIMQNGCIDYTSEALVYFMKHLDHSIYVGGSNGMDKRFRSHNNDGKTFICALRGSFGTSGTAEYQIHEHFASSRIRPSQYVGNDIYNYVAWLIGSGFASTSIDGALKGPCIPFECWHPAKMREPIIEDNGQPYLFYTIPNGLERLERASKLPWLSSKDDTWFTPQDVVELIRKVFGGKITTDPASCSEANETIKADYYYTQHCSGLNFIWLGNVLLNPPYGSQAPVFIEYLIQQIEIGNTRAAVTILNLNSSSALWFKSVWKHARIHCVWTGRIDFTAGHEMQNGSPSKGTILSYFGPNPDKFAEIFSPYGQLIKTL